MKKLLIFLTAPVSILYYCVVVFRNLLFDIGVLRQQQFAIPLICVGNLSAGGTGKTPHTEYIARLLLNENFSVAILSRGYRRKTTGFMVVNESHSHLDAGDEPCMYTAHFASRNVIVAVDSNRRRGIAKLMAEYPGLQAIILDDAFQHRYVKAGLNIVLTDYFKPFYHDLILPFGTLREPVSGLKRADAVVITKSPPVISPLIRRDILSRCKLKKNQPLFFSHFSHGELTGPDCSSRADMKPGISTIFLFTGIANPYPLEEHLKKLCLQLETRRFADHHRYSLNDIQKILNNFDAHLSTNKILVTTEKDMMRLRSPEIMQLLSDYPVCYVPVEVVPDKHDKDSFHKLILDYVRKNQRNR